MKSAHKLCSNNVQGSVSFWGYSTAEITEEPQSVTALVGTVAQFHCAGTGNLLTWFVDGLPYYDQRIKDRGIVENTDPTDSSVQSNLTVPATLENNGTSVQCAVQTLTSVKVFSNYATLRVFPGMCLRAH